MIHQDSLNAVRASRFSKSFVKPLYESFCFANIPTLVSGALSGDGSHKLTSAVMEGYGKPFRNVVVFLIDAFGWRFYEQYRESSAFLRRFEKDGRELVLTSQFPSTTSAHVTTMHTGLPVGKSGVFEWYYYDPTVDDIVMPLLFSFGRDRKRRNSLLDAGITAETILPAGTFYQRLAAQGVRSMVFQNREYAESPYSQAVLKGAQIVPVSSFQHSLDGLVDDLERAQGSNYYFVYCDNFDAALHHHGPGSAEAHREVTQILEALERSFMQRMSGRTRDTLVLVTADHGQVEIDPGTTFYVDRAFEGFQDLMRTGARGNLLAPGGSPRDFFIYVKQERLAEAHELLSRELEGRAEVRLVSELVESGLFGPTPEKRLLDRVSNLVVLPYPGHSVWWSGGGVYDNQFWGHHGGLTPQEMEIPLAALEI